MTSCIARNICQTRGGSASRCVVISSALSDFMDARNSPGLSTCITRRADASKADGIDCAALNSLAASTGRDPLTGLTLTVSVPPLFG